MINYKTYYNSKNRVEISINKKKLSKMAKDMAMKSEEMHQLLSKILTPTHQATKKDLNEWIEKNVPIIPRLQIDINGNDDDPFDESMMQELDGRIEQYTSMSDDVRGIIKKKNDEQFMEKISSFKKDDSETFTREEVIEIIDKVITVQVGESPIRLHLSLDILKEQLRWGLNTSTLKDGRFYRIRFGWGYDLEVIRQINENEDSTHYHFWEKLVDLACSLTREYLKSNIEIHCNTQALKDYITQSLVIKCQ